MTVANLLSVLALSSFLSGQEPSRPPQGSLGQKPEVREASGQHEGTLDPTEKSDKDAKVDKDREEVTALLKELESTLEQTNKAHIQVGNVRKIVDVLDEGAVKATEKELVKTNQFVRQQLAKDLRELRSRSRSLVTQVNTAVLPKQRGVAAKLKARWEMETDLAIKPKIAKLLSEQEASMSEIGDQVKQLETNISHIGNAIMIIENQLGYLELVEESLGLGRQVSQQLKELNQEIDKVVNALVEKEIKQ